MSEKCPICQSDVWHMGYTECWCKNINCINRRNKNGLYYWFQLQNNSEHIKLIEQRNLFWGKADDEFIIIISTSKINYKICEEVMREIYKLYEDKFTREEIKKAIQKEMHSIKTSNEYLLKEWMIK